MKNYSLLWQALENIEFGEIEINLPHQENKKFITGEKIHEPDRQWYELTAKIVILLVLGHYSYKKLICNAHSFHPKNG